jgi:hypothetical protein
MSLEKLYRKLANKQTKSQRAAKKRGKRKKLDLGNTAYGRALANGGLPQVQELDDREVNGRIGHFPAKPHAIKHHSGKKRLIG